MKKNTICVVLFGFIFSVMFETTNGDYGDGLRRLGCFKDSPSRILNGHYKIFPALTNQKCVDHCARKGFYFAGTEYWSYCFCGNEEPSTNLEYPGGCNMPCSGNPGENCGGGWAIAVYPTNFTSGGYGDVFRCHGCFQDSAKRLLPGYYKVFQSSLTTLKCIQMCASRGFHYAGTEAGSWCFCGNKEPSANLMISVMSCNMACSGDGDETCGGGWAISVYSTNFVESADDGHVLRSLGCFEDSANRILPDYTETFPGSLTTHKCVKLCALKGFKYAGTEASMWCFCGNKEPSTTLVTDPLRCNMACSGDPEETCGGGWALAVYSTYPHLQTSANNRSECGVQKVQDTSVSSARLISYGHETKPGEFPWLVAIYHQTFYDKWAQQCGGTLISPHIVITAAHCLVSNDTENVPLEPSEIRVGLGKRLRNFYANERSSVISEVKEVVLPRDYVGETSFYAWDIGLLDLKDNVQISPFIMPACVDWFSDFKPAEGVVAGWGRKEDYSPSEVALYARLKFIEYGQCMNKLRAGHQPFLTHDKFCAGNVDGSQVAFGDSGGGLTYVKGGKHFLVGVVSTKVTQETSFGLFIYLKEHCLWLEKEENRLNKVHTGS